MEVFEALTEIVKFRVRGFELVCTEYAYVYRYVYIYIYLYIHG